jgi:threonine dehydratase
VAGQGTLGLELADQVPEPGTVVIPVGGGGLLAGAALALKAAAPGVRVVGVHAAAVPTYLESRRAGEPVTVDVAATVADGIAVGRPSTANFSLIESYVDDLVTVPDDAATAAVTLLLERAKLLVEPSGAVGLAALLAGLIGGDGPVTVVLSGGNIDLLLVGSLVRNGLEGQGRYASFTVVVPDRPGRLASVLATIGDLGANVLTADHYREGRGLPFGMVEIRLSVETRSAEHREALLRALRDRDVEVG